MRKLSAAAVAAAACAAVAVIASLAGCSSLSAYAALVDGHRLSQRHVDGELRAIKGNQQYMRAIESRGTSVVGTGSGTFDAVFVARILTRDIYFEVVHQEVARRHLRIGRAQLAAARKSVVSGLSSPSVLSGFPKSYQDLLVRRSAETTAMECSLAGPQGCDGRLQAYYATHAEEFQTACASHILVPTKAKADELAARLAKGDEFATVAIAESQDPGSAPRGGDLGCFPRGAQLVPEFITAAFGQPVGEVGPPVQTSFGFHLIKVTSRGTPPFEQVKDQVRTKLRDLGDDPLTQWLVGALGRAKVKLNPRFGTFSKAGGAPVVIPPQAPSGATGQGSAPGLPGEPVPGGSQAPQPAPSVPQGGAQPSPSQGGSPVPPVGSPSAPPPD